VTWWLIGLVKKQITVNEKAITNSMWIEPLKISGNGSHHHFLLSWM